MKIEDEEIRKEISSLLSSYKVSRTYDYSESEKEVLVLSWIDIANRIGKLQTQSSVDRIDKLENEINNLRNKIIYNQK